MSDIRIYNQSQAQSLVPLTGDVILCTESFNSAPANSVHLCTNATGPVWKSFANDAAVEAAFVNQYSLSFNGSSDYLEAGSKFDFIQQTCNFTASVWLKINDINTDALQGFMGNNYTSTSYGLYLFYDNRSSGGSNKKLRVLFSANTSNTDISISNGITDNAWHHYAVTCTGSGGTLSLYVDGSLVDSTTAPATTSNSAFGNFRFGSAHNNSAYFGGFMDEAAIFSSALTSEQVASLIDSSGVNPVPADISGLNPSAWYRMGDDANDTFVDGGLVSGIQDSSGSGNHATTVANSQPTFSTAVPS